MNERYLKYKDKINTHLLKDTVLNVSFLCDKKLSNYKPEISENNLNNLLSNKKNIQDNKQLIFENLVWYAVYISQQVYFKRYKKLYDHVEYVEYLQYALERLWFCLNSYDMKNYNCSIYSYVLNDYKLRVRYHIEAMYNGLGLQRSSLTDKYKVILKDLATDNKDIQYILDMTDDHFKDIYACNRKSFLCYVAGINVISLENLLNPDDRNSKSIKDTINDSYSEEFYKVIDARFIIKDIEKAILKRYKNYKFVQRDLQIFEEFAITNITYRELARKYGTSKQAIHQILQRFKYRLKNSTSLKRMLEEEKEL